MIKIDWMLDYHNMPRILLEDAYSLSPMEECEFTFNSGMWYHIQNNGIVRYIAHDGSESNNGGFGGAVYTILHNGEKRHLKGPWSSRAAMINTILPKDKQILDILLYDGRNYRSVGILVSELLKNWDQSAYLLRSITEQAEQGPITVSLASDCILKPNGQRQDKSSQYEIFAEPVNAAL